MFLRKIVWFVIMLFSAVTMTAETESDDIILLISSYNPDTHTISENLRSFMSESRRLNSDARIIVENMNCTNLPEANQWKKRMADILGKYTGVNKPSIVVLLGQEAWSAFLSQDDPDFRALPSLCALVSRNTVLLPEDSVDVVSWEPESVDIKAGFDDTNIIGGYAYEYHIRENINVLTQFYPDINSVYFLTDNTFGGLCLQSWIKSKAYKYPDYEFNYFDGRNMTFKDVHIAVSSMPPHSALLCGTWRVDSSDDYIIGSTTHALKEANPSLPVLTLSRVGLGHWALGGYVPDYQNFGQAIAADCISYLRDGVRKPVTIVDSKYLFDIDRIKSAGFSKNDLPEGSELVNQQPSVYQQYKSIIWTILICFIFLVACLVIAIVNMRRKNKLSKALKLQSEELKQAILDAESANKLKTVFIQNISHEFRTPLNAIVGFSEVVSKSADESMKKYAEIIKSNSDYFLKLVNDMLEMSVLDSGVVPEKRDCSINELCAEAIEQTKETKKPDVKFEFIPWANERAVKVSAQPFISMIKNLLHNAFKFTETGKVVLKCECIGDGNTIKITVTDTGIGIPLDQQTWVFERFAKLDNFQQGAGLGLPICRHIVETMHGEIKVDPTYSTGCRIVLTFPIDMPA